MGPAKQSTSSSRPSRTATCTLNSSGTTSCRNSTESRPTATGLERSVDRPTPRPRGRPPGLIYCVERIARYALRHEERSSTTRRTLPGRRRGQARLFQGNCRPDLGPAQSRPQDRKHADHHRNRRRNHPRRAQRRSRQPRVRDQIQGAPAIHAPGCQAPGSAEKVRRPIGPAILGTFVVPNETSQPAVLCQARGANAAEHG